MGSSKVSMLVPEGMRQINGELILYHLYKVGVILTQSAGKWSAFIKEVIKHRKVWTIMDDNGIPTSTNINLAI
jgi:hypothetical protein